MKNPFRLGDLVAVLCLCVLAASSIYLQAARSTIPEGGIESVRVERDWRIGKVCEQARLASPVCAWCGVTNDLEAHHIEPVWAAPGKALDRDNLIVFCRRCHFVLGHAGNFGESYVINIREVCELREIVHRKHKGVTLDEEP